MHTLLTTSKPPKPSKPSKVETLRWYPLPPLKGVAASDSPPGCVKAFFLEGKVPSDTDAQAEIARFCVKNKRSQALAWLFLRLEEVAPAKQQALQLAHTDEVPPEQRLNGEDAKFLAKWLMKWIGSLPLLNAVNLSDNFVGDDGAKAFAKLLAGNFPLHHLLLASCDMPVKGTQRILNALTSNTELRSLDVSFNACGQEGATALGKVLAREDCSLRTLEFSHVRVIDKSYDSFMQPIENGLAKNKSLQRFGFAGMALTQKMLDVIQAHPAIKSISLAKLTGSRRCENALLALVRKPLLEGIDLSDCDLSAATVQGILLGLQQSKTLQHIDLSGNTLKGHGQRIAGLLKNNEKLTSLQLQNSGMQSKDVVAIFFAASVSRTLLALNLRDNDFFTEKQAQELDRHLLLNRRPRPAQLKNAANALHILVSRENSHCIPSDLTRSIAGFIGALGVEGIASLDNLTATAGRLTSLHSFQ